MMRYLRRCLSTIDSTKSIDFISALVTVPEKHTIMESLYFYPYLNGRYCGYIIVDKRTKKIVAIDCGDYRTCRYNIEKIMKEVNGSFDTLLLTHGHDNHCIGAKDWHRVHPELQIIGGSQFFPYVQPVEDGKIIFVGDLCIYCMKTPGHTEHDISYVITEVSENSTKTPVVFPGDTLFIGGVGEAYTGKYDLLYNSVRTLKSLPNETIIFSSHFNALENIAFAHMIESENFVLKEKLKWAKEQRESKKLICSSILAEERLYNPYFRTDQAHFKTFTEAQDPVDCFMRLKIMQNKIMS
ncbi:unnamed protein product [Blepharisma stoltei]|uniref:Metallo-beta-lactamase domain-containing protein n=1 Tax=Blepharisma stoltei TaxID=1481888 RepID=A0AAU9JEG4_9CILI|nr:unnamed protein product [Blepharisma stoltei]